MFAPIKGPTRTLQDKLRDRYIAARFPGLARNAADLDDVEQVIKAASFYYEEEKYDRALELLDLALLRSPADETMLLARRQLASLTRNRGEAGPAHPAPVADTPTWIRTSWDLASEVHAADFHRAMAPSPAPAADKRRGNAV